MDAMSPFNAAVSLVFVSLLAGYVSQTQAASWERELNKDVLQHYKLMLHIDVIIKVIVLLLQFAFHYCFMH